MKFHFARHLKIFLFDSLSHVSVRMTTDADKEGETKLLKFLFLWTFLTGKCLRG